MAEVKPKRVILHIDVSGLGDALLPKHVKETVDAFKAFAPDLAFISWVHRSGKGNFIEKLD